MMQAEIFCSCRFSEVTLPENNADIGKEDREIIFFCIYQVFKGFLRILKSQVVILLDFAIRWLWD